MPVMAVLAATAWGSRGSRRSVLVRDLRAGMAIALPFREFRLPWLVLTEPVPVSTDASMVMLRRLLHGNAAGAPVGVRFVETAQVDRLPRHFGVCSRCGGLSPCVDEWIEATLMDPFDDEPESASAASLVAPGEGAEA